MARDTNNRPNFIKWYREIFGFSNQVATALYDDQLFQDAATIAEFGARSTVSVALFAKTPAYQSWNWL
jgi:hypothetical protein